MSESELRAAAALLQRGDAAGARHVLEQAEAAGRGSHQGRLWLAQACATLGDDAAAHRALERVLAEEPGNLWAYILRGDLTARAGDDRAAVSWYQGALRHAERMGQIAPDLRNALGRADAFVRGAADRFANHLSQQLAAAGVGDTLTAPRFAEALDLLAGRKQVQLQQPTNFYYPRLPQRPWFECEEFAWVPALEAAAPAIRAELEAVLESEEGLAPYVVAEPNRPSKRHSLMGDPRWSAFHLWQGGAPVAGNADRCPATMAALAALPIPRIAGRSPMAMFSVLRAGTHIPPHHGMINTRLICHLPLIVPDGCRLRVGNETRAVEAGRMMIFDDSMEHEAWNDGDSTRVILLFEIWRPELDHGERQGLTALFDAIGGYGGAEGDQAGA